VAQLAYRIVLTENAGQAAVSEKNRAGTLCAGNRRLFRMMDVRAGDINIVCGAAFAGFALQAFCAAVIRAEPAWAEEAKKFRYVRFNINSHLYPDVMY